MKQILTVKFIKEINGRTYSLDFPMGCPIGEAYDACHELLAELSKAAAEAVEKSKQVAPVDTPAATAAADLM